MVVFMALAMLVSAPISMIGGIIMALRQDVACRRLIAVAVPCWLAVGLVIRRMVPQFRLMQTSIDSVNRVMREQITGIRVVRAFVREDLETARFGEANATLTSRPSASAGSGADLPDRHDHPQRVDRRRDLVRGRRVESGAMQVGSLTAFMAYLIQILISVMMATFMAMMIPRASVSADRIGEVLGTESSVAAPTEAVTDIRRGSEIVFDHVDFHYPGAEAPCFRA